MNRRNFFKNLGTATVGVIVAPVVIMKAAENISKPKREGYINVEWPTQRLYGIIVPKRRRSGYPFITNGEIPDPKLIKELYRRYGNQRMNYFQLLKSLGNG